MNLQNHETIVSLAQNRAALHPERDYVIFLEDGDTKEARLTYGELDRSARNVAAWLASNQIRKGERALVILPNGLLFTQVFYGCLYAGILAVPLSEPAGPHQMQAYLETFIPTVTVSKPKVLITTPLLVQFIQSSLPPHLKPLFQKIKIVSATELIDPLQSQTDLPELAPTDIAYLQFTSGSTGTPKGIMIGHNNIMANMKQAYTTCNWKEGSGTALWLPLFHDFGLAAGMIGALYMGGFVVLTTPVHFILKPIRWLQMISKYKCAYSYAPPFAYEICRKKINPTEKQTLDLSSLVCSVYGAEPVQYEGVQQFNDYFFSCGLKPNAIRPGFGMAETVIMFSVSAKLSALCVNREILETEGRAELLSDLSEKSNIKHLVDLGPMMAEHEIVIKTEDNHPAHEGQIGEIMIGGPSVCQGYFENPEATKAIFQQQIAGKKGYFLATGDLGLLWQGNLYFTGRIKDLIIIRGRNYYPQDIEYALTQIKELRAGCIVAYAETGNEGEQLSLAMEVRQDLLKDINQFHEYILPIIDQKIVELIGQRFQIYPERRLYLQPGVITKTSSGKIKHQANVNTFKQRKFEGRLAEKPDQLATLPDKSDITAAILRLFKKIVEQEPSLDVPFLELGGDSIKLVEFVEAVQEAYPVPKLDIMEQIDETTTLADIARWLQGPSV